MKTAAKSRQRKGRNGKLNIKDVAALFLNNSVIEHFSGITYICYNENDDENYIYFDYNQNRDEFKISDTSFKLDDSHCDKIYEMVKEFLEENQEESESQINENYAELERSASIY